MRNRTKRLLQVGIDLESVKRELRAFTVETPSWGYAQTGTRFGKFLHPAAASTFEQKVEDAAEVHRLTGITPRLAVHVLWDFPKGFDRSVVKLAADHGLKIGAINPNVFQDQCYKYGSLANPDRAVRRRAIEHCLESIAIGRQAGSRLLSLWFADGTNYPGQDDLVRRRRAMAEGLAEVHAALPASMTMLIEYKPFEPAFYSTDIPDWGTAALLARACGPRAKVLVDTGHHLHATNVEQIVAGLLDEALLGGFHFNDRKYADDDLTAGSIAPYQLFLIFDQIVASRAASGSSRGGASKNRRRMRTHPRASARGSKSGKPIAYMIDQSHNEKPKVEAMVQTVVNIHNPNDRTVRWRKKITQPGIGISKFIEAQLKPDEASREDCDRVVGDFGPFIHGVEGFLVIESSHSLDVTAVYTAGKKGGEVESIAVEQIRERKIE